MTTPAVCPRCHGPLASPGLMSSAWRCGSHGAVQPYHLGQAGMRTLAHLAESTNVPVWLPDPAPRGWLVTGMGYAGDPGQACATAIAMSGPSPLGGAADLVLIAEEPGVGLGQRYAGIADVDLTDALSGPSAALVDVGGHPVRLWLLGAAAAGRTALVGEAEGVWIWMVMWPEDADVLLFERLALHDLRSEPLPLLEFGAPSPRLAAA